MAILCLNAPATLSAQDVDANLKVRIEACLKEEKHEEAYKLQLQTQAYRRGDAAATVLAARYASWAKLYDTSIAEYDKALAIQTDNVEALVGRARVRFWKGDYPASMKEFRAIYNDSHSLAAGEGLITVLFASAYRDKKWGALDEAETTLKELELRFAGSASLKDTRKKLGELKFERDAFVFIEQASQLADHEKYAEALSTFDRASPELRTRYDVRFKKAQILAWSGEHGEAATLLRELCAENANDSEALVTLSRVLGWQEQWDQALPPARQAVETSGEPNRAAYLQLGMVYRKLEEYDNAVASYDRALTIFGPDSDVLEARADALLESGKRRDAKRQLREAFELFPEAEHLEERACEIDIYAFSLSFGFDDLLRGEDWRSYEASLWYKPYSYWQFGGKLGRFERYGDEDHTLSLMATGSPFASKRWILEGEASVNLDPDILWDWRLSTQVFYKATKSTIPTLGAAVMNYDQGIVQVYNAGLDQYLPWNLIVSYRLFYGIDYDSATSVSHELRLCYERENELRICAGYVFGQEAYEIEVLDSLASVDVQSFYLRGKVWLGCQWGAFFDLHHVLRDSDSHRRGFTLGVFYGF